jgi:hypothetical protein
LKKCGVIIKDAYDLGQHVPGDRCCSAGPYTPCSSPSAHRRACTEIEPDACVECADYCTNPGDVTMLRDPFGQYGGENAERGIACGGTIATDPNQMICCNPPSTTCPAGTYPELCLVSRDTGSMLSKGGGCADCDSCADGEEAIRCGEKSA